MKIVVINRGRILPRWKAHDEWRRTRRPDRRHQDTAQDPYWEIERRERWSEHLMPSTFDFRDEVYSSSSLAGVLTGHIHRFMASEENGHPQWVVPGGRQAYLDVEMKAAHG